MKDCTGCPVYELHTENLALCAARREETIAVTGATARLVAEALTSPEPEDESLVYSPDKLRFLAKALGVGNVQPEMVIAFNAEPRIEESFFSAMADIDLLEEDQRTQLNAAQATCVGPRDVPGEEPGSSTLACTA